MQMTLKFWLGQDQVDCVYIYLNKGMVREIALWVKDDYFGFAVVNLEASGKRPGGDNLVISCIYWNESQRSLA